MGIGITELLIIVVIVALLFGTKKLRSAGGDLGTAISSFRQAMSKPEPPASEATVAAQAPEGPSASLSEGTAGHVIEGETVPQGTKPKNRQKTKQKT